MTKNLELPRPSRHTDIMLSIVIPTLNEAARLPATLTALGCAAEQDSGTIEIVVSDGGSTDGTADLARAAGARVIAGGRGRGQQLAAGAAASAGDWLLFLHADTRLSEGWRAVADAFMENPQNRRKAGYCRFRLDDGDPRASVLEDRVAWRCRRLGLPYGDQGLLIRRGFYRTVGDFRHLPLFEDVDLARRIGRRRLVALEIDAVTSADRYRAAGYGRRSAINVTLLSLYYLGLPPALLAKLYR